MGLSRVMELVSQAEKEGVSLGVLISKEMSPEEMQAAQIDLAAALSENYASIGDFMAGIKVASIDEILSSGRLATGPSGAMLSDELTELD